MAPNRYTISAGVGGMALAGAAVNEFHPQNDFTKRVLLVAVPVAVGVSAWIVQEVVSVTKRIWPGIRDHWIQTFEKRRLKEEFGPGLQARINHCNETQTIWLEVRDSRHHSTQHKLNCRREFEKAQIELTRYRAIGVKYNISYYDSSKTRAPLGQTRDSPSIGLLP